MGNFPESLSRAMLVGVMLVGRLGVPHVRPRPHPQPPHNQDCPHGRRPTYDSGKFESRVGTNLKSVGDPLRS